MKRIFGRIFIIGLVVCLVSGLIGVAAFAAPAAAGTQAYTFKNVYTGAGGGFLVDVIFHPAQQNLIYAKTDIGGVYRWNQSTGKWIQLLNWVPSDKWSWTGGESVAIDPSDPNKLYIAGGTYTNSWDPNNGVIMRSSDQGNTFQITQMPFKMGGNMPGRGMGERLAVDPNKGSILYFGARDGQGLWKSSDSGVTWSKVTNFPVTGVYAEDPNDTQFDYNNHPVGIPWVIFDKSTGTPGNATQTIYVGVADGRSGQPNIYQSTNGGSTWSAVPGQPTCTLSGNIVTCTGGTTWDKTHLGDDGQPDSPKDSLLAKQATFDSAGTMYVTYSNWAGPYRGSLGDVWKYVPSTSTWTKINPGTANNYCGMGNQYWGYGGLGVDPQHPGTLVVAAVNSWWPDGQLFRTTDGGTTWNCLWTLTGWPTIAKQFSLDLSSAPWLALGNPTYDPPEASVKLGWMMEGLKIDPFNSNKMLYGTGATLYGTTNLTNWDSGGTVAIASMAQGMEETSVLGLVSPPTGTTRLFSAVGDVGGWKHTSLDSAPSTGYTIPSSGTMMSIDYAENNPSFLVRVGWGKSNNGSRQPYHGSAFTFDSGGSWFQGNTDIVPDKGGGTVAAAADASRVLWAPQDGAPVSWSSDNGNSWHASTNIPQGAKVASDRVNGNKFYGFGGGKFWYSTDGAATFTASAATGFPTSGSPRAVIGHEGDVWVTGGELISGGSTQCSPCGLWHTTNGGTSFTKLANVDFAAAIGFGKAAPGQSYPAIYLFGQVDGGILTIYRSDDGGASWVRITDDQHMFATIQTITGDPTIYGRVYFGTNGLGSFYGDIAGAQPPTNTPTRTNTPGGPTNTPLPPTNTPTRTFTPVPPTITNTPLPVTSTNTPTSGGGLTVQLAGAGTDNNQQSGFNLKVVNTGTSAQSNISMRVYFTPDGSNPAANYVLEKYYDQSGTATVSGPTLLSGSTYYFTVNFGSTSLSAGNSWNFNTAMHLSSWGTTYDGTNDYWHTTGTLPAAYTDWPTIPAYVSGSLIWGSEPGGGPTNTPAPATNTPTRTNTPSVPTNTPTRTNTPSVPTNTPTRTNTPAGPTNTPVPPTNTPTRTNTPVGPTNTPVPPTNTPIPPTPTSGGGGGTCSPVNADITAPYTYDGAGTFCWRSTNLGSYTNNWNMNSLTINGVNFTNVYVASGSYPAQIGGYWYVGYDGPYAWSHFEAK